MASEWVVERASRRIYNESDDIQGHLVGDGMRMTAGGFAKPGAAAADFAAADRGGRNQLRNNAHPQMRVELMHNACGTNS